MRVKQRSNDTLHSRSYRITAIASAVVVQYCTLAVALGANGLQARASQSGKMRSASAPAVEVLVEKGVAIPVRDGIHLVADVFRPAGSNAQSVANRVPVILARTPYGRNIEGTLYGKFFAEHGYAFVAQDVRGRFDSEGTWTPFVHESDDGSDSIDWLVKQPWCNGDVAMFGASYSGMCAWYAAATGHSHLRAVIAMVNVADPDQFMPFTGGVFHIGFAGWAKMLEAMEAPGGLASIPLFDWEKAVRVRPLGDIDTFFKTQHTYVDEALQHPLSDRKYWDRISYLKKLSGAKVAGLHISGWFDVHRKGTFSTYERMRNGAATPTARDSQHLIIGPWAHLGVNRVKTIGSVDFGPNAITNLDETMVRFLDHHLKGLENGFGDDGRVRLFVTGENKWWFADDWPPSDMHTLKLSLSSAGTANSRQGGGTLGGSRDTSLNMEFDEFRYDPVDPPPFLGSMALYPLPDHTADKSTLPDRKDVLDFSSAAFTTTVDLVGPVQVVLYVSTNAPDTDFAVELFRVTTSGGMFRLTGSIRRLRYRDGYDNDSPVKPGQVTKLVIDCPPIGCRLDPGDRLHLQIGSAACPAYAPNLNTLDPIATATEPVTATSRVWHSAGRESYITVSTRPQTVSQKPKTPALPTEEEIKRKRQQ